jgi:hypothetical protein
MLRHIIWLIVAVAVAGTTVYLELIADVRTPTSRLAMRGALVTHNKLPPESLAAATVKLQAKFGPATKVWQGPTGIYARQDGDILAIEPARTFFHETLGITQVADDAGAVATFPFHVSPYEVRDGIHPNLVPSLKMRVSPVFQTPPDFDHDDFAIEQCRMVSAKALGMDLAGRILGLGSSTICTVAWKREPARRMLAGIVVANSGRWIRPLVRGLCRRLSDAWLANEHHASPQQPPDYLQCFLVDRPENQPFGTGVSSFAYEVRKDGSLAVFRARPLAIEEVPLSPDPRAPTRPRTADAVPLKPDPGLPTFKRAESGDVPLKPDPSMPKFHRVEPGEPERQAEPAMPAGKNDPALDGLRRTLVETANKLSDEPCSEAAKIRYLVAAVSYARMWLTLLPCLEKNHCVGRDADRRDQIEKSIGLPWQHDVMDAAEKAHHTATIRDSDFPKETLVFMANLASDPSINPLAEIKTAFPFPHADCATTARR